MDESHVKKAMCFLHYAESYSEQYSKSQDEDYKDEAIHYFALSVAFWLEFRKYKDDDFLNKMSKRLIILRNYLDPGLALPGLPI